jgi:hypothetical protein
MEQLKALGFQPESPPIAVEGVVVHLFRRQF